MKLHLKPIKPKRISDQVFDQIMELISKRELKPGDKLMPERELSVALDVSRTTVRNAISKLVAMELLEHKQGQGTSVRTPDPDRDNFLAAAMRTQDATLEDLLEVRMGLECNAAALAAERAGAEDIRFLEKSLKEMETEVKAGELGTEGDVSFHVAVSHATKNPVQIHIMRSFYDFLFQGIRENLAHLYEKPEQIEDIREQHEAILDAIKKRLIITDLGDSARDAFQQPQRAAEEAQRATEFSLFSLRFSAASLRPSAVFTVTSVVQV